MLFTAPTPRSAATPFVSCKAASKLVPIAVQGYQELRTIFLAIPVERSMQGRSESWGFKHSSPLPAAARRRNSSPSVLVVHV
jgi:hypothetical protein